MSTTLVKARKAQRFPKLNFHSGVQTLRIERTDINFYDVGNDTVRIELTIRNTGEARSQVTPVVVEAAILGAFVTSTPIHVTTVPELKPGDSHTIEFDAIRPRTQLSSDFASIPPNRLLTALDAGDEEPEGKSRRLRNLELLRQKQAGQADWTRHLLPPDVLELVGQGSLYWAGNLNIFIGDYAVERHMARALRIYEGRVNLVMFFVGDKRDSYQFRIDGTTSDWTVSLYLPRHEKSLVIDPISDQAIQEYEWIDVKRREIVVLASVPPKQDDDESPFANVRTQDLKHRLTEADGGKCTSPTDVNVQVTQKSTGNTALVEFSFDPSATGPGCYTI